MQNTPLHYSCFHSVFSSVFPKTPSSYIEDWAAIVACIEVLSLPSITVSKEKNDKSQLAYPAPRKRNEPDIRTQVRRGTAWTNLQNKKKERIRWNGGDKIETKGAL
jgi:hypothetical protein